MTGPCAVLTGALLALAPGWAAAQPAESADMPRTPWGRPDLGGVWVNGTTTPLERPESFGDREFLREGEAEELPRQLFTDRLGRSRHRSVRWPSRAARRWPGTDR